MGDKQISVLVVDDESAILEMIQFGLGKSGMAVRCAQSGEEALIKINEAAPDILLLDWMMPNMSGPELIRHIIKPFSPRELVARINALLRRAGPGGVDGKITLGSITIDTESRQLCLDQKPAHIGPTEYRLLEFFMTHANRSYSRSQLLDHVWGTNVYLEERTVDVHIRPLRRVLQVANLDHYIQTVRSHGYRFSVGTG
jgi:two-component system phosphate regulon response regulator PhoB